MSVCKKRVRKTCGPEYDCCVAMLCVGHGMSSFFTNVSMNFEGNISDTIQVVNRSGFANLFLY